MHGGNENEESKKLITYVHLVMRIRILLHRSSVQGAQATLYLLIYE